MGQCTRIQLGRREDLGAMVLGVMRERRSRKGSIGRHTGHGREKESFIA
jgi:hypothetical protein